VSPKNTTPAAPEGFPRKTAETLGNAGVIFSADHNALLTVKIHSRPVTAIDRAKGNHYVVVLQVTNNTEHVLSLPKTLTSSEVLRRCWDCWSVNDTWVKQYHDQHHHQFNFNYSRKAIKIPPTGTLKVDKPCIIFSGIWQTKLIHKKHKYWYIAYHGLLTKPLEYNLQSTAQ